MKQSISSLQRWNGRMIHGIILGIIFALVTPRLWATTYYVDFSAGADSNTGTSADSPWKRVPGDPNATGNVRTTTLIAGDTVLFKGGISYNGTVMINFSGQIGKPIVYKGDGWGVGKAIMEGSAPLSLTWTQCASAADCSGNPNYASIYYATPPVDYKNFTEGLFEDGEFMSYAESPNPTDPFNYDDISEFYSIPYGSLTVTQTNTSITDPGVFTQSSPDFWNGGSVILWIVPNVTTIEPIIGFNPATHTITYDTLKSPNTPYTDRDSRYALINHPSLIDRAGEYALSSVQNRLYAWPLHSSNPNGHVYSTAGGTAFEDVQTIRNVTIEGFQIQHYTQGIIFANGGAHLTIRNNEVKNLQSNNWYAIHTSSDSTLVDSNRVEDCSRSIGILIGGSQVIIRDNVVQNASRQGIWLMGASGCQVLNNTVTDIGGTHSNGISIYMNSSNIRVTGNIVLNCTSPITFEQSSKLMFFNNIAIGTGGANVNDWGGCTDTLAFCNNTFVKNSNNNSLSIQSPSATLILRNNILDGGPDGDHNIFTGLGWWQDSQYGNWHLGPHEIVDTALNDIFLNPSQNDYRLKPGSIAIDSGADLSSMGFDIDILGNKRPVGTAWDIGAYEYSGATSVVAVGPKPAAFQLSQNYPNPFNTATKIRYQLSVSSFVKLSVFDVFGREVAILVNEEKVPGIYTTTWNATGFASGTYIAQLRAGIEVKTLKLFLIK